MRLLASFVQLHLNTTRLLVSHKIIRNTMLHLITCATLPTCRVVRVARKAHESIAVLTAPDWPVEAVGRGWSYEGEGAGLPSAVIQLWEMNR